MMYVDKVNTKTTSQTWSAKIAVTHFTPPLLHTCVHTVVVPLVLLVMCSHWSDEVHHVWQKPANSFCVSWYRLLFTQHCPGLLHSIIQSTASGCFLTEFRLPCVLLFTYQKCFKREFCLNAHLSSLESTMTDHYEYRVGGFTFSYHSQMPKL